MKRYVARLIVVFLCIVFIVPSTEVTLAADTEVTVIAQYRQDVEVTVDLSSGSEISTLDPAIASGAVSLQPIQNLFLSLTDVDPVTNAIRPELATDWSVSDDGLVWTFHLRDDVMWMRYDPATGEAETLRPLVAEDFVYAIKRACIPRWGGYYGKVIAPVIAGCDVVNNTPREAITDTQVFGDTTKVESLDEATLEIRLSFSAGYFLSMTTMAVMSAVPHDIVAEIGDEWTLPGYIVTNGPYFLEENVRGVRHTFIRNENFPDDLLRGSGNIDRRTYTVIEDGGTSFALFQDNLLDATGVPARDLDAVLQDSSYQNELYLLYDIAVFYFGYKHDKAPFDNVHVRRAFSAVLDRQAFLDQIWQGRGVPMIHFTPPGLMHAPPIDEVGLRFDPDFARQQMTLAGYPDCEGFPNVNILTYTGAGIWADFWAAGAEEYLGCDPALFDIEQLDRTLSPEPIMSDEQWDDWVANAVEQANVLTLGWGAEYPDAQNMLGDVLHCESENAFARPCTDIDDLIQEAATETNQERRGELYLQIEEGFFGEDGEFPIAPIYLRAGYLLFKTWYTGPFETDGLFNGVHWEAYSIDMAAKLAGRGE